MDTFRKILFPVDLSESSEKLVPIVMTMIRKFDAELHLLFVVRILRYFTDIYVPHPSINLFETEMVEGAQKKMEEFRQGHFADLTAIKANVLLGDPADTIIGYIKDSGIEMVVMGTHGRKGLDRVLFGSVAERVIKTSPVPVLVANPF
jgi:nucleotide-binding universal stress UspA family protein